MKILVVGAGPLGSLLAARLAEGGHEVALLARGARLAQLREHGIVLHDARTGTRWTVRVPLPEALPEDDGFALGVVVMRKNRALEALPALAATRIPTWLFLMNNAAGPGALVQALGAGRGLVGFPMSGGYLEGPVVHCLTGRPGQEMTLPLGEPDGTVTARTREVAAALACMPGFRVEIRTDMDAWLKHHVALLMPSLAAGLYACGTDRLRMLRTRDVVVLSLRAMREGAAVLRALGVPTAPRALALLRWLPEPLLVRLMQARLRRPEVETAMVRHANAARDEMRHLAGEFQVLVQQAGIPTPAIDRLRPYLDPATPPMPDGSATIPLDWGGVAAAAGVVAAVAGVVRHVRRGRGSGGSRPVPPLP